MIVADTNIISYLIINSEFTDLAEKVYKQDPEWSAPRLWRSEFRNILAFYNRNNVLSLDIMLNLSIWRMK